MYEVIYEWKSADFAIDIQIYDISTKNMIKRKPNKKQQSVLQTFIIKRLMVSVYIM